MMEMIFLALSVVSLFVAEDGAKPRDEVVAMVNGSPVFSADVDRELARALRGQPVDDSTRAALRDATVQQLIDQQLIAQALMRQKEWASNQDVDLELSRLEKRLGARGQSLEDFLSAKKLDQAALRRQLVWQVGWGRYLEKQLTDENLEKYFQSHLREYDGTRIRVAQVLIRVGEAGSSPDDKVREEAIAKAKQIREDIVGGKITFADAAAKYSTGPSAKTGGDLGFIGRREPMPEVFSKAVFQLEKNTVSEPVVSSFGVHLIQWTESKPGQKTWFDVRGDLEEDITQNLFQGLAKRERMNAKIELKTP
ncbi:MAG: Foldase protein PrsA precursor [Planctomycetota bacterium]